MILKDFTDPVKNRTIWGNTANSQFLGLGYWRQAEGEQKHHYPPAEPPWIASGKDFVNNGLSQKRISEIIGNANFGNIDTLISQGHDMEFIAGHYNMDLPLLWALRLKGKTDQEKFKEHGRGLGSKRAVDL